MSLCVSVCLSLSEEVYSVNVCGVVSDVLEQQLPLLDYTG